MTKTHRELGEAENILKMANSAQMVLPLPVGAPTNTSSSVLYRALNTVCVWERGRESVGERERACGRKRLRCRDKVYHTLSLDGVKEGEEVRVQLLVVGVAEGGDGQRLQVQ